MATDVYVVEAPSNIAFLKYWGKADAIAQWPANDSLSMTLRHARTHTRVQRSGLAQHVISLEGRALSLQAPFAQKMIRHLAFLCEVLGESEVPLRIDTRNTFPASCGIASSASGMAAFTVGVVACLQGASSWEDLAEKGVSPSQLASWARRGSGSACRSLWGGFVAWEAAAGPASQRVYPIFSASHWDLCDILLLVSTAPKTVSSSEGHATAWESPLFLPRLSGLAVRKRAMLEALEERNLMLLGPLLEQEALEMHSIMLSVTPPITYLTPQTAQWIVQIRRWRQEEGVEVYFTIDAGPNLHLICESGTKKALLARLAQVGAQWLEDSVGDGPTLNLEQEA